MKKLLLFLLPFLLLGCTTIKPVYISKDKITKSICEVEADIKQNEIFLACHEFILDEFSSYNGVLKYHDKESGVLLLNWNYKCNVEREITWGAKGRVVIECSTKVKIVDNIVNFEHRVSNTTMKVLNSWNNTTSTVDINDLSESEISEFRRVSKKICSDFERFLSRY